MRSRIRNEDTEPDDDEDNLYEYEYEYMRIMKRRIKDMWMMGTTCMRMIMRMMMGTTCMRLMMRMMMRSTTCMRMISHQRLPKPRLEIRAEQNGDGGVGVSKSDDHLCQ